MLIAAPTVAGKTNIAVMTILQEVGNHINEGNYVNDKIRLTDYEFKIIYISPMKALAAEIVSKFSKQLAYLGIQVKELTGDM